METRQGGRAGGSPGQHPRRQAAQLRCPAALPALPACSTCPAPGQKQAAAPPAGMAHAPPTCSCVLMSGLASVSTLRIRTRSPMVSATYGQVGGAAGEHPPSQSATPFQRRSSPAERTDVVQQCPSPASGAAQQGSEGATAATAAPARGRSRHPTGNSYVHVKKNATKPPTVSSSLASRRQGPHLRGGRCQCQGRRTPGIATSRSPGRRMLKMREGAPAEPQARSTSTL